MLCGVSVVAGLALVAEDAQASEASLRAALAAALEENRELRQVAAELWEDNTGLRERLVLQAVELERLRADLAVLQRMLFGRSSERSRPEPSDADADAGDGEAGGGRQGSNSGGSGKKRGPGGAARLLGPAAFRGVLGLPGGWVLLPGVRGGVHAAG